MTRKSEIHAAAARLFGEKGFAASSVRDIAHAVGIGAASLYNHIGSKDDLLVEICFRCAHTFINGLEDIENSCELPVDKIEALIRLHIDIALGDKSSVTVFNDEWRHLPEPQLSEFLQLRRKYETAYLSIIREGIRSGKLRQTSPNLLYQHILSSLRWLHTPGIGKARLSKQEVTEQITSMIIKSISI
jgi:AcrR family transcriptional regulator